MDAEVLGVDDHLERYRRLEADYQHLRRLCSDAVKESEAHRDEAGIYLHHIEPGTWRLLVAAVSEPVQAELFKEAK